MGCKVSLMRVDFPEPDTPVTTISVPKGNFTSTCFKLFPVQPHRVINFSLLRRIEGTSIFSSPLRYRAVSVCDFNISSGVPWKTTSPPFLPAFGPMSMIQSAALIMSSSCSTTMTVLPKFLNSLSDRMRRSLSR